MQIKLLLHAKLAGNSNYNTIWLVWLLYTEKCVEIATTLIDQSD